MVRIRHQKIVTRHQVKNQYSYVWNYSKIIKGLKFRINESSFDSWEQVENNWLQL